MLTLSEAKGKHLAEEILRFAQDDVCRKIPRMRNAVAVVLCLAVLACQQETKTTGPAATAPTKAPVADARNVKVDALVRPMPVFLDHAALGSQLGPDGTVSQESASFQPGQPISLTLVLRESPGGLQTAAVWSDAKEKVLRTDREKMNGKKVVTFTMKDPLKPGKYHVVGYWGENIAADKTFEVTAPAKKTKK